MNITPTSNGFLITDIVNNQLIKMQYIGYSKKAAIKLFKEYRTNVLKY